METVLPHNHKESVTAFLDPGVHLEQEMEITIWCYDPHFLKTSLKSFLNFSNSFRNKPINARCPSLGRGNNKGHVSSLLLTQGQLSVNKEDLCK